MPPPLPRLEPIHVQIPITHGKMTVWPGPPETIWDYLMGFPFELRPLASDYLWISCNGEQVEIKPHYLFSTWDTFWADASGNVRAQALGGLFPFTLGKEAELLRGIVSVLEVLPERVRPQDAASSQKIEAIYLTLREQEEREPRAGDRPSLGRVRGACASTLWRWKLGAPRPTAPAAR